jgi:hypothetical protein
MKSIAANKLTQEGAMTVLKGAHLLVFARTNGSLHVPNTPGLGVSMDPSNLRETTTLWESR